MIGPLEFFGKRVSLLLYLIWMVIPLSFCILKLLMISAFEPESSDWAARLAAIFWPLFVQQYENLSSVGADIDAHNFAIFVVLMLCYNTFFAVHIFTKFLSQIDQIRSPNFRDLIALLVCVPSIFYAIVEDVPVTHPNSFWNFYVDKYGMFYFRQGGLIFFTYCFFAMMLFSIIAWLYNIMNRNEQLGN